MKDDMTAWSEEIRKYAIYRRASRPIPERDALSWPQILQMHIIKGSLLSRINNLPLSIPPGPEKETGHQICIVFTSSCPGLAAAKEIPHGGNLQLVSLYSEEYHDFLQSFPDNEYRHHAHVWSHFLEELDSDTGRIAKHYPVNDTERYWLHIEGIMLGHQLGRGAEHLWSWNGSQAKLLKKSFLHWAA